MGTLRILVPVEISKGLLKIRKVDTILKLEWGLDLCSI